MSSVRQIAVDKEDTSYRFGRPHSMTPARAGPRVVFARVARPHRELERRAAAMSSAGAHRRATVLVGDVHGHRAKLVSLFENLEREIGAERLSTSRVVFLGDLVDRGPETSGVLDFIASLPAVHPSMEVRILGGNHDLGMATFCSLWRVDGGMPPPEGYVARRKEPPLWVDATDKNEHARMHLQGRRWGAFEAGTRNAFDSEATFASFGVDPGDPRRREALLSSLPESHAVLLSSLEFVVELDDVEDDMHPEANKLIAVHAGLELERPIPEQLEALRERVIQQRWIEALQGRTNVGRPANVGVNVLVASGHHGILKTDGKWLVVDECAGLDERQLAAVVLPERAVVKSH